MSDLVVAGGRRDVTVERLQEVIGDRWDVEKAEGWTIATCPVPDRETGEEIRDQMVKTGAFSRASVGVRE